MWDYVGVSENRQTQITRFIIMFIIEIAINWQLI